LALALLVPVAAAAGYAFLGLIRNGRLRGALRSLLWGAGGAVLIVFSAAFAVVAMDSGGDPAQRSDYAIVLGAGIRGEQLSLQLLERLTEALGYLARYPDSTAILSGGQGAGETISEAEAMFRWLTDHGIEADRLVLEDKSTSTLENIRFSKALIPGGATVSVITNGYHARRAAEIAAAEGLDARVAAAASRSAFIGLNYMIREALIEVYTNWQSRR
jgi:uncharacterized SAM-binding protein YcdF (DUF218 family)